MPTRTSCPECKANGYVHKGLYDPNKYASAVASGDHRKWCDTNRPGTSTHADSTNCRVCWGTGYL